MTSVLSEPAATVVTIRTIHGVRVAVLAPPHHRRTCVAVMGFGAWLDPFELQRFTRLSQVLDAQLIVVESPGLGQPGTSLTRQERVALLAGRYAPVAQRMLAAATTQIQTGQRVHLLGYSMGTSIVTAMAAHDPATSVTSLTLIEPVATRTWNPAELVASVHRENQLIDGYLQETAAVPGSVGPSDRIPDAPRPARNTLDQLLLAAGLSWGRLATDLRACADRQPPPPVLFVHGRTSQLSRPGAVADLARSARDRGLEVTDVTIDGSHGLWQSLPRVDELAQHIDQFWSTT